MSGSGPTAFVFPGQGSQRVGMGKELAEASEVAREVFEEADDRLGIALSRLCWEGPEEDLQLTANTQPALLAVSIAAYRVLEAAGHRPAVVAGHSLGEYSALVAAGALTLADGLLLVRRRGELMQQAVPVGVGTMAAILGLPAAEVAAVAQEAAAERSGEICSVANYNAPEQTVIAGHAGAVELAMEKAKERGARRALPLQVSAPFHCSLMAPARDGMRPLLEATRFSKPRVPVITNVDAAMVETGEALRESLVRQIDSPVRWVESVELMAGELGVERTVEVGPGNVLSGLIRRIAKTVATLGVAAPGDVAGLE